MHSEHPEWYSLVECIRMGTSSAEFQVPNSWNMNLVLKHSLLVSVQTPSCSLFLWHVWMGSWGPYETPALLIEA